MTDYEVISEYVMTSKTYKIKNNFNDPLYMNDNRFNYYLKILACQFSNVVPNVETTLLTNGDKIADPGIYDITELVTNYNQYNNGTITINSNIGKLILTNTTANNITITTDNFLTSKFGGFSNITLPYTLAPGASLTAANTPIIQDYNFFVLACGNVTGYTYTSIEGSPFLPCNTIYTFPSNIAAFHIRNWTAIQALEFKLDSQVLNYLEFEIKDGLQRSLSIVPGAQSDFSITCQVIKKKRL